VVIRVTGQAVSVLYVASQCRLVELYHCIAVIIIIIIIIIIN